MYLNSHCDSSLCYEVTYQIIFDLNIRAPGPHQVEGTEIDQESHNSLM